MRIESRWGLPPQGPAQSLHRPSQRQHNRSDSAIKPGRQCPTTETADAAREEVVETRGALAKLGWLLWRPMRTADPIGTFRKNQNLNRSTQVIETFSSIAVRQQPVERRADSLPRRLPCDWNYAKLAPHAATPRAYSTPRDVPAPPCTRTPGA
jgi:hypothetical protein